MNKNERTIHQDHEEESEAPVKQENSPQEPQPETREVLEKPSIVESEGVRRAKIEEIRESLQEQPVENDVTTQSINTSNLTVRNVYKRYAKWYDLTRKAWNSFFAASAEKEFDRLIAENITDSAEILDVGVGTGLNIERVLGHNIKFGTYEGIDLTPEMLDEARKKFDRTEGLSLHTGDIMTMEILKKYDAIISTLVFSHLKEQDKVLQKLLAALKPGGKLLLLFFAARIKPRLRDKAALWVYDHILHFSPVPADTIRKFPASEVEKQFPSLGGQMSVYVFQQRSDEDQINEE